MQPDLIAWVYIGCGYYSMNHALCTLVHMMASIVARVNNTLGYYLLLIVDTGERGSDTNGGHIKDQDRGVPEELLVRRSALSEGGRIETVINIKLGTTGTNDTHIPSVVTSSLSLSLSLQVK